MSISSKVTKYVCRQVQAFWKMEKTGLKENLDRSSSVDDRRAEDILETTTRLVDGHYETLLLWKELSTLTLNFISQFTALTLTIIFITHLQPFTIKKRNRKSQPEEVRAQRPKE